jgi:hypothetical protein
VTVAQRDVDQQPVRRRRRYKANFTRALSWMKHQIARLLTQVDVSGLLDRLTRSVDGTEY